MTTDALIEKVAKAQFRFIVQSHGNEWVVFDRERQIAVENHANQLNALTATKPLNARAAAVAVMKEVQYLFIVDDEHRMFTDFYAALLTQLEDTDHE
jgi:hypothetical protein